MTAWSKAWPKQGEKMIQLWRLRTENVRCVWRFYFIFCWFFFCLFVCLVGFGFLKFSFPSHQEGRGASKQLRGAEPLAFQCLSVLLPVACPEFEVMDSWMAFTSANWFFLEVEGWLWGSLKGLEGPRSSLQESEGALHCHQIQKYSPTPEDAE